jgi:integrase
MYYDNKKSLWKEQITIDGKRKVFSAKKKADVKMKILEYKAKAKQLPTLEEVADAWQEEHWLQVRQGSLRGYNAPLRRIVERFGDRPIDTIAPKEIQRFINELGKTYAQKTIQQHKIILNMIYNFAIVEMGLDVDNRMSQISLPSGCRKQTRGALSEEQKAIVSSVKNSHSFILPFLIYWTGCRLGEALALQLKDVDFKNRTISITKQVTHIGNQPTISSPKTENSYRIVPLLPTLESRLKQAKLKPTDYIVSMGDTPLTKSALARRWVKWCTENDLVDAYGRPIIDRHTIRHQYATTLYEAGIEAKSAQALLGHSDIRTTLNIYTHVSQGQFMKDFSLLEKYTRETYQQ